LVKNVKVVTARL